MTESPIGFVYDAISLPETQHIGWGLLADNGILILTLPAAVKDDESKGRKAIMTIGYPHWPQNEEVCRNSWARVEKWLSEGVLQVCFTVNLMFRIIHKMHLCSRTNMKSFRTGLKASLEDWRG